MMRMVRIAVTAAIVATSLLIGTTYAAELTASTSTKSPMEPATCAELRADIQASGTTDEVKRQVKSSSDNDCWTSVSQGTSDASAFGVSTAAAWTHCGSYWANFGVGIAGLEVATSHTNVGLCWNGTKFTGGSRGGGINWGPDCNVTTIPVYFGGIDWCGVYWPNTGHTIAEPGNNFWVAPYSAFWWHRFGWMRFDVRATNGSSYNFRGGCCS
jgi:hypothetical protein